MSLSGADVLKILAFVLGVALIVQSGSNASSQGYVKVIRHPQPAALPKLIITSSNGVSTDPSIWRGRVVVLNIWATWCGPCVQELPSLDRLQKVLEADNVLVVALAQDRAPQKIVPGFLQKLKVVNLQSFYDPNGKAVELLRIPVLPTTLILDKDGKEVARIIGALDWSSEENVRRVRGLIKR